MESDYFIIDREGKKLNYDCLEREKIIENERKKVINFMKETLNGDYCIMIMKDEYTDEKYHILRWSDNNSFRSLYLIDPNRKNIDKIYQALYMNKIIGVTDISISSLSVISDFIKSCSIYYNLEMFNGTFNSAILVDKTAKIAFAISESLFNTILSFKYLEFLKMAYNKHNVGNNEKSYETIMSDISEESYPGMLILKMK